LQVNPNLQQKLLHETYEIENVLFDFTATGIVNSEEKSCNLFHLSLYRKIPARTLRQQTFKTST